MKKYIFVGLFVLSLIIAPLFSQAQYTNLSTDEIQRLIASLRQQIAALQAQLAQQRGEQSGEWCHTFNQNLGVGAIGREVRELHTALVKEDILGDPFIAKTNYRYTEDTAATVSQFQLKYKNEILTPNGLSAPTGYFGPSSRRKMNSLYGCNRIIPPIPGNRPPTISGVSGPTTLRVGETGTWTVQASDPENGPLSYSVIWGDEEAYANVFGGVPLSSLVYGQTATFTHVYTYIANPNGTTYTPAFFVKDNTGQSARTGISVNVSQVNSPITILTPNGSEQWMANSVQPITWRYNNATSATKVDLYLLPVWNCPADLDCGSISPLSLQAITLDENIDANAIYNWIVGTDIINNLISAGDYLVYVCPAGAPGISRDCDVSDNYFTIVR